MQVITKYKFHTYKINFGRKLRYAPPECGGPCNRLVRSILQILVHQIYARHMYIFIAFVQKTQRTTLAYLLFVASNYAHTTLQHIIVFNAKAHATYTDLM